MGWKNCRKPSIGRCTSSRTRPHRRKFLLLIAIVAVIALASRAAIAYWVDLLWFGSLGYGEVFWKTLGLEWGVFAAFAALTFLFLLGAFLALKRAHSADLPATHAIQFGGQSFDLPVATVLRAVGGIGALLVALITGAAMEGQWPALALYWYAPRAGSVADPIFGRPLDFYLFTLPAWQIFAGWLLTLAVICCLIAALFLLVTGGARALGGRLSGSIPLPWRGLSASAGFLLLVLALRVYIGRFELLFEHHTIFDGVTYTDAHVTITGLLFVCAALVLGAAIAFATAVVNPRGRWLAAAIAPAAICYIVVAVAGWYVTTFLVKPNQLDREKPYIADNIQMTRQAYGLDRFAQHEFPAETTPGQPTRPTTRPLSRTSGCGTGTPCKTRCVNCRRFAPTTIFPTSTSTATRSTALCAR